MEIDVTQIGLLTTTARRGGFVALLLGIVPISASAVLAQDRAPDRASHATPPQIVDALKAVAGDPPGARASFAKGQCVQGTYTPTAQASEITKSPNFTKPGTFVGRFSVGGGNPKAADNNKAVLRGFAMRVTTDGQTTTLLVENAPVHFARTLDQMLAFLKARAPGADGKPDAAKVKAFSDANPETLNQAKFVAARPLPASFAGTVYWGVHAFPATNAQDKKRYIKFKVVPVNGELTLSDDDAKLKPADFLIADLTDRIKKKTASFDVLAILDKPGDPVLDITVRWPDEDNRPTVKLGRIDITTLADSKACDETFFNPSDLADGVGAPPDEIFAARRLAYETSLAKRRTK